MEISDREQVCRVLGDPAFVVPPVPAVDAPIGIAWLRAHVSRFSNGEEHARRRALVDGALARLEPAELRRAAREAAARPAAGARLEDIPLEALAAALALPPGLAADVATAAAAYQPHAAADLEAADAAVGRLVDACGGAADEATAVRICLLVQAAGTAALLANAARRDDLSVPVDELVSETLRGDPPVPTTRRVATASAAGVDAGTIVTLDLTAGGDADLQFGAGLRPCPGRAQALALVAGALEGARAARA